MENDKKLCLFDSNRHFLEKSQLLAVFMTQNVSSCQAEILETTFGWSKSNGLCLFCFKICVSSRIIRQQLRYPTSRNGKKKQSKSFPLSLPENPKNNNFDIQGASSQIASPHCGCNDFETI